MADFNPDAMNDLFDLATLDEDEGRETAPKNDPVAELNNMLEPWSGAEDGVVGEKLPVQKDRTPDVPPEQLEETTLTCSDELDGMNDFEPQDVEDHDPSYQENNTTVVQSDGEEDLVMDGEHETPAELTMNTDIDPGVEDMDYHMENGDDAISAIHDILGQVPFDEMNDQPVGNPSPDEPENPFAKDPFVPMQASLEEDEVFDNETFDHDGDRPADYQVKKPEKMKEYKSPLDLAPEPFDNPQTRAAAGDPDALNQLFGLTASLHKAVTETNALHGKVVVLTGRPPKPYQKADVAKILKAKFGAAEVAPVFSRQTQVLVYSQDQDTQKLKAATQAGILCLPYSVFLPQRAASASVRRKAEQTLKLPGGTFLQIEPSTWGTVRSILVPSQDGAGVQFKVTIGPDDWTRVLALKPGQMTLAHDMAQKGEILQLHRQGEKLMIQSQRSPTPLMVPFEALQQVG